MNKKSLSLMMVAAAVAACNSQAQAYVSVGLNVASQCAPAYVAPAHASVSYVCPPPLPAHHAAPAHCHVDHRRVVKQPRRVEKHHYVAQHRVPARRR